MEKLQERALRCVYHDYKLYLRFTVIVWIRRACPHFMLE